MIERRFRILGHVVKGRNNGTPLFDALRVIFGPTSAMKSRRFIDKIETDGEWNVVYFKRFDSPLFFPRALDLKGLYPIIAEQLTGNDWHEYDVWGTKVERDDVILDCGAAEGLFALMMAHRCKQIYAVEPFPALVSSLRRTFRSYPNVEVLPVGLGSKREHAWIGGDEFIARVNTEGRGAPVEITTVDELFANQNRPVTYIKADMEGMELGMIEGARETLKKYAPKIAITTYHVAEHAQQLTEMILSCQPKYTIRYKGIEQYAGAPVMLHAWA